MCGISSALPYWALAVPLTEDTFRRAPPFWSVLSCQRPSPRDITTRSLCYNHIYTLRHFMFSQEFSPCLSFHPIILFRLTLAGSFYDLWILAHCKWAVEQCLYHSCCAELPSLTRLFLQWQSRQFGHDEISLELQSKWVCGPLFWCSGLWWSKTFVSCWVTILLGKWNLE